MAGISFDDLVPKTSKAGSISFDDLVPQKPKSSNPADVIVPQSGGGGRALAYGLSAGQLPFANRITSALAAGAVAPFVDETYSQLYGQAMADTRATQEANPGMTTFGNVAGALSTLPAAFSKTPQVTGALSGVGRGLKYVTDAAGKLVTASPFKGSGIAAGAGNLGAKMVGGATVAAPITGAYFAGEAKPGEMGEQFMQGAKLGGIVGGALPVAGAALGAGAALLTPKIDDGLVSVGKLAQKYKIPLSLPSLTSSEPVKNFQKLSQSIPFSGEQKFRTKQMEAFNRALTKSFGYESPKITPEVMDTAFKKVGAEFDNLGKGKIFDTAPFGQSIDDVLADSTVYTQDALAAFSKEVDNVKANFLPDGTISGERLGKIRTRLNRLARKTNDSDKAELFKSLENSVIDLMTAGDDVAKAALSDAKRKYKNLLVVEPLSNKAVGGDINPTLLANRAEKIYGRAYTTGNAGELGDLARIGKELLAREGGSDTTPKLLQAGLGGTALTAIANPSIGVPALGIAGAAAATNRGIQSGILRNQYLINRAINKADDLLKVAEQGGQITGKMVSELPQAEKNKFLKYISGLPAAQATAIMSGMKDKVK